MLILIKNALILTMSKTGAQNENADQRISVFTVNSWCPGRNRTTATRIFRTSFPTLSYASSRWQRIAPDKARDEVDLPDKSLTELLASGAGGYLACKLSRLSNCGQRMRNHTERM